MMGPEATSIFCPHCGANLRWPAGLDDGGKAELARVARENRPRAIRRVCDELGLPLGDAKSLGLHISRAGDVCVRCKTIVGAGESVCPTCKALNLNW
jgi:hypothetical protein